MKHSLNEKEIFLHRGGCLKNNLNGILQWNDIIDGEINTSISSKYVNLSQLPDYISESKQHFTVLTLNCQSINAKFNSIILLLETLLREGEFQFSAICLQETWLSGCPPDITNFRLPGYNAYALGTTCSSHGGLICYIQDQYNANVLKDYYDHSEWWEGLFLEISSKDLRPIILGNIYRPPKQNNNNQAIECFNRSFETTITKLNRSKKDTVIVGDFNIDLLKIHDREKYNDFLELMMSNGFFPKITYPTRFAQKSASLIDHIYIKSKNLSDMNITSGILFSSTSDHLACFIGIEHKSKENKNPKFVEVHTNDSNSLNSFIKSVEDMNIFGKLNTNIDHDPSETYKIIEENILDAKKNHLPTKRVRFNKYKHKKNKWITKGILNSIRFRDKLYFKFKSSNPSSPQYAVHKTNLATYNKILNTSIREAKQSYYDSEFQKYKGDIKNTWKTINMIINRDRLHANFPTKLKFDNKILNDKQEIVETFNNYFSSAGRNLSMKIPHVNQTYQSYLTQNIRSTFSFKLVDSEQVSSIINQMKPKTSCGDDNISMKLLKSINKSVSSSICVMINQSLTTGIYPEKFKIAKVMPLMKKPNVLEVGNYRPISLLNSISKVLEKAVFNQLMEYFETNKLLYSSQYGYRKFHSTESACLELTDSIAHQLDEGNTPFCLFLDLSKAFDTLDHSILLNKLSHYGVPNANLKWFDNYLSNRKQYVEIDGVKSQVKNVSMGVPQGSILGPLLFIIYMNDISTASKIFNVILYADDTSLASVLNAFNLGREPISTHINQELDKINTWLMSNKLSLNVEKTKYMIFRYSQSRIRNIPKLYLHINGKAIEQVQYFDFLGLVINENLTWKHHIDKLSIKIAKVIGIMSKTKYLLNSSILLKIYNSLILSSLHYGILCWGHDCHKLVKLQKKAVRIISKAKYNAHTDPIFKKFKLLKLPDIFQIQSIKLFYKHEHGLLPSYFRNMFQKEDVNHIYNLRRRQLLKTHYTNKESTKKTIRWLIPQIINNLPPTILEKNYNYSIDAVKISVKDMFLSRYADNCILTNCYICNRM